MGINEMIQRRTGNVHSDSTSMAGILAPEAKRALPKNYHQQNMMQMRDRQGQV